jgi:hypothetical protein
MLLARCPSLTRGACFGVRFGRWLLIATTLTLAEGSAMASPYDMVGYRAGDTAPTRYTLMRRWAPRVTPLVLGGILFGSAYSLSVYGASQSAFEGSSPWMTVPIVGPFVAAGAVASSRYPCGFVQPTAPSDCNSPFFVDMLIFDGLVQAGAAALLAAGLSGHEDVWFRNGRARLTPILSLRPTQARVGVALAF